MEPPSPNGSNGRDSKGRFAPGCQGGPGNPMSRKVGQLRTALISAVTVEDIQEIVAALVRRAKNGDIACAREVLTRTLGKPIEADLLERLEQLETVVQREQAP